MDDLARCRKLVERGNGYTSFARINDDSTWTFEIVEVIIVGRTQHRKRNLLKSIGARDALLFLNDMIDSAKTEAKHGGKL